MDTFSRVKVFNPELTEKAIRIKGFDTEGEHWNSVFLVSQTNGEYILLIDYCGTKFDVHMENFEHAEDGLKIIVLEEAV
jgi:hypothetical protein